MQTWKQREIETDEDEVVRALERNWTSFCSRERSGSTVRSTVSQSARSAATWLLSDTISVCGQKSECKIRGEDEEEENEKGKENEKKNVKTGRETMLILARTRRWQRECGIEKKCVERETWEIHCSKSK